MYKAYVYIKLVNLQLTNALLQQSLLQCLQLRHIITYLALKLWDDDDILFYRIVFLAGLLQKDKFIFRFTTVWYVLLRLLKPKKSLTFLIRTLKFEVLQLILQTTWNLVSKSFLLITQRAFTLILKLSVITLTNYLLTF